MRELLLRLIWQGGLRGNAKIAEEVLRALDYERSLAIKALFSAGTAEQRSAAVALVAEKGSEWGTRIVGDAIDAFYPEHMSDAQLAALLEIADEREGNRGTGLDWTLGQIAARAPVAVVQRMLVGVMPLVRREPHAIAAVGVSKRYEWLLDAVAKMSERLLPAAYGSPDEVLSEAVELLGRHAFWRSSAHVNSKELSVRSPTLG